MKLSMNTSMMLEDVKEPEVAAPSIESLRECHAAKLRDIGDAVMFEADQIRDPDTFDANDLAMIRNYIRTLKRDARKIEAQLPEFIRAASRA